MRSETMYTDDKNNGNNTIYNDAAQWNRLHLVIGKNHHNSVFFELTTFYHYETKNSSYT